MVKSGKKGKDLDKNVVSKVIEFYESEDNGRIMPNKKIMF